MSTMEKKPTAKSGAFWVARTAIFIALVIVVQAATAPLGQYVTGSLVNLVLIMAAVLSGLASGMTVALTSPVVAFLLGIGPKLFPIVPIIMIGNLVIVLIWHLFVGRANQPVTLNYIIAIVLGALAKFLVLFIGAGLIMIPLVLKLEEPQATVMKTMFSYPQLITATIGGIVATPLSMALSKSLKKYIKNK